MNIAQKPSRAAAGARASKKSKSLDVDLATTKPGTPGGVFMRQFWIAVGRSQDLATGKAKPIRIMSENFTLYRGASGKAFCVDAQCPHRFAMMHLGWVEGDDIRCVYHGWKFDGAGQCIEQPAEEAGFARKVKIGNYPCDEYLGLVWVYFGEGKPPAFPPFPHRQTPGVIDVWNVEHVPCNYLQSFENSMDEVHVAFTHAPGGSHARLSQDLPIISAEERDWGLLRFGKRKTGLVRQSLHYAPNVTRVIVPPQPGMDGVGGWPELYFSFTPVDDENHLWLLPVHVQVAEGPERDAYLEKRAQFVKLLAQTRPSVDLAREIMDGKHCYADIRHPDLAILQDIAVQAGQGRIADRAHEHLGRSDAGIIAWRKILTRELKAIAEGRKPKKWKTPPADIEPTLGF